MQVESLGRYLVEKELGRGAMGRVFLAYDPHIDRRVALKTIQVFASLPESERAQARERFLREARSAGRLLHPGIVTIFDVGEADGVPYLAMEFVEGDTLDTYCREETLLPVPVVVGLIASAAEALAFAHERGIVHRDIKPANLMRVRNGSVKIMDFGLAKNPTTSMTHDGALLGTPNYMSPEQVRGEPLDGRADLFSLAVVAFEMLTGGKPFAGDSISSVLYRVVHEPPRETASHDARLSPAMSAFLEKALAKNPSDRFQDGASFAAALRMVAAGGDGAPPRSRREHRPTPEPAHAQPEAPRRRSPLPWLVGVAGLTAIVAAGLLLGRPSAPSLTARVHTDPAGLAVLLDGAPLAGDSVRFGAEAPFGVLTAAKGCRETSHRLEPADAGRDIVLVLDPERVEVTVDAFAPGARLSINGRDAGAAPATVELDLCRENILGVEAAGYRSAVVTIPAKATPLEARNAAAGLTLEALPAGRLILPAPDAREFWIDGAPALRSKDGIEVLAGEHQVRAVDAARFVDVTVTVSVPEGGSASPRFPLPALARLVVQTFPPNCRVAAKRSGFDWTELGETPLRRELAAGRYTLRVTSPGTGETRERDVDLSPGANAPIRMAFGRLSR